MQKHNVPNNPLTYSQRISNVVESQKNFYADIIEVYPKGGRKVILFKNKHYYEKIT